MMNPIEIERWLRELAQIEESEGGSTPSEELLRAYREGRLAPEEAERLEALLAGQPEARARLAALAGLALPRPPERIRDAVLAAAPRRRPRPQGFWRERGTWAAAAGIVLAVAALVFRLQGGTSQGKPLPAYEVGLTGIAAERSAPASAAQAVEARPETRISISAAPERGADFEVDFGLYRQAGDRLERVPESGEVRLVESGGAAGFEAPARALVGTEPGDHPLFLVVAPRGGLPGGGRLGAGEDAVAHLAEGGRLRVYALNITVLSPR